MKKHAQILDSIGKPALAQNRRKRRPTVVVVQHRSANNLLDPLFDPANRSDKKLFKRLKEARSLANKSETEEDVQVVGGLGDDGNLSLVKKETHKGHDLRRKGIKDQRRLSRISLGKNLMLSQTAGLKLQWTVGHN